MPYTPEQQRIIATAKARGAQDAPSYTPQQQQIIAAANARNAVTQNASEVKTPSWLERHGRDLASTAGGIVGGALAMPAAVASAPSLIGPVAIEAGGAGLGAAAGGSLYDALMQSTGRQKRPGPQEQMVRTAKDIGYNAMAVPGGQVAGAIAKPIFKAGGKALATALGATTGAGPTAVIEAAKAGAAGGRSAKAFQQNLRGEVPVEAVVPQAKKAVGAMYKARADKYRTEIQPISNDPTVLNMNKIEQAVASVKNRGSYKGQNINKKASSAWDDISKQIKTWKNLNPADYHTAEGMDALKRSIGDISQSLPYGSPAKNAADKVYNAIKLEIENQAPDYARVMKDYESASVGLKDLESSLSLGKKANTDTSLRKLQSILKNNVNSGFARRSDLARGLESYGADTLFPSIAGQALSSPLPRGLSGVVAGGAEAANFLNHGLDPKALALLAVASPRAVGEAAYYAGKGLAPVGKTAADLARALRLKQAITSNALRASDSQ
jgi:hypothetical protein